MDGVSDKTGIFVASYNGNWSAIVHDVFVLALLSVESL